MKTTIKYASILYFLLSLCLIACDSKKENNVLLFDDYELAQQKELIKQNHPKAIEDYQELMEKADALLKSRSFSVTNKKGTPPSGSKHDYMTIAPYWWKNPSTENGLPYIRKDGEINPDTRNDFTDFNELQSFFNAVITLRDAYYFTTNKNYSDKAIKLIQTWFIDEQTRMNPNMNFAQSIPGKYDGRCFGIIEFEKIIEVLDCLQLFKDHNILKPSLEEEMNAWLSAYINWLQNSTLGIEELERKNNHGTLYDVQLLSILTYLGETDKVKEHLNTITKARIFDQIETDGSQPRELARTKSFNYSVMNLHGFLQLAIIGKKAGVDVWGMESEDGRSIKKGYLYMLPYLKNEKPWEYKQIKDTKKPFQKILKDLKYAQMVFEENDFEETIHKIESQEKLALLN
ncbi:alginate lyase family protein [Flammeovirga sp. OC4]|uniref:alginate lyase family protein n=1 Tax=Flammeovirga sp. OC4 TaxID=1382345 RepID=UPI000693B25D|nr:alginate lyase family protein [Flammeovirga sp. OC4]